MNERGFELKGEGVEIILLLRYQNGNSAVPGLVGLKISDS